jgi:hypothetical protein
MPEADVHCRWCVTYSTPTYTYDKNGKRKQLKRRVNFRTYLNAKDEDDARSIVQKQLDEDAAKWPEFTGSRVEEVFDIDKCIINRIH